MKYAVFYSLQAPVEFGVTPQQVYAEALDQIARADELGLDQVWLTEHHFMDDAYCPSPMIAAAAIAGRTKHIPTCGKRTRPGRTHAANWF